MLGGPVHVRSFKTTGWANDKEIKSALLSKPEPLHYD
jgi:hypothetical protein